MMLIIIKDAAKFDDIVCVCGFFLCVWRKINTSK